MQKRVLSLGLVVLAMLTASRPSFAQAYGAAYQSFINTLITNKIWEGSMKNYGKDNRRSPAVPTSSSSRPPEVPDYRKYPVVQFKPSGTRLILQEYLDGVTGTSQDKAEAKELVLGILGGYETAAAAKGLPYDLALATVSYIGLNRHVYSGAEEPIIPFEQNVGLRDVLAENMTKSGVLANYSDQKKQEIYEFLVIFGGITYQLCDKARKEKNAEELKNCKLASAQNLKFMGIEP
jgi:hypothetical protein